MLCALHDAAGDRSQLLLATDSWKDPETLLRAYHDSQGSPAGVCLGGRPIRHASLP